MKTCSKCKIAKNITDYYIRNASKDGRNPSCISCCKGGRKKICIDCGNNTQRDRCRSCYNIWNRGPNSAAYKTGRCVHPKSGYVYLSNHFEHPNASKKSGLIAEHTLVLSNWLERPLVKGETAHHKNGVRTDNRIENLELWSTSQPAGQRVSDKVAWAKELLRLYEPEALNE